MIRGVTCVSRLFICCLLLFLSSWNIYSQKSVYIPSEWDERGIPYSMERSHESDNFILFWGEKAGTDPTTAPEDIRFNPASTAATLEEIFRFFDEEIQLIPTDYGNYALYKFIIVINETWNTMPDGSSIFTGWAFGGSYDSTIGSMWIHPKALNKFTLAHEFTHSMQNMVWIDYPGHGFINHDYVGSFWESHANFMALQVNPEMVENTDPARFLNTQHFYWSSARHHYTNWMFLQYIKDTEGMEFINRMWRESNIGEHPLQTLMRLKGISQSALNDLFINYAVRNVLFDYSNSEVIRNSLQNEIDNRYIGRRFTIPAAISIENGRYIVPKHRAPQDYGYNIVKLIPDDGSDFIHMTFRIHENGRAGGGGARSVFVFVKDDGTARYSQIYINDFDDEIVIEPTDREVYMVVLGAPNVHHNYVWEPGFPRIYRFPWEFRVEGARPEGYNTDPNSLLKNVAGRIHLNGGGFVANTASVSSTAYVGPDAVVLGYAIVEGEVRIEDAAVVYDNASVRDNSIVAGFSRVGGNASISGNSFVDEYAWVNQGAVVSDYAVVKGSSMIFHSSVSGAATVKDNSFLWGADLSGSIILGWDAEHFGQCNSGEYLQIYNLGNRGCDGLTSHYLNVDINTDYTPFSDAEMGMTHAGITLQDKSPFRIIRISTGELIIRTEGGEVNRIKRITAISQDGKILFSEEYRDFNQVISLYVRARGIILLRIETDGSSYTEKIVL